ncbi:MAG TPA: DUF2490 domain-containing protein [Cytophagaceae bacterium]|nr:DUF2490 domain-containing protein [Cytophagaceae bacterium]
MVFSINQAFAQPNHRNYNVKNSQWNEINIQGKISKKFNYQLDIQYRRQSDQMGNKANANDLTDIWKNAYQTVFRPWVHFFPTEDRKLRLSISPLGWWSTTGNAADGYNGAVTDVSTSDHANTTTAPDGNLMYGEMRSSYQATTYDQLGRFRMQYRARYELRWIANGQPSSAVGNSGLDIFHYNFAHSQFKTRLRFMVRTDIALKGKTIDENELYLAASDELFIGFSPQTAEGSLVDQNRAYFGVGYKLKKDTRIEIGYLNQMNPKEPSSIAAPTHVSNVDFNNVIQVLVMFDNFNRFFERKEKTPPVQ